MADDYIAVKKLAATVLIYAARDLKRAVAAEDYSMYLECRKFLTNPSPWHSVLDLDPTYIERWVNSQPRVRRKRGAERQRATEEMTI